MPAVSTSRAWRDGAARLVTVIGDELRVGELRRGARDRAARSRRPSRSVAIARGGLARDEVQLGEHAEHGGRVACRGACRPSRLAARGQVVCARSRRAASGPAPTTFAASA
jgi:hypothetical protein